MHMHYNRYGWKEWSNHEEWEWCCPFDRSPHFAHYSQDLDERKRVRSQAKQFFMKSANSRDALPQTIQEVKALQADVSRFGSSITGSDAYWQKKKSELIQIVEQGGAPHIFFTLTYADHYWQDLHRLLGSTNHAIGTPEFMKWKGRVMRSNPGIVNEFSLIERNILLTASFRRRPMLRGVFAEVGFGIGMSGRCVERPMCMA